MAVTKTTRQAQKTAKKQLLLSAQEKIDEHGRIQELIDGIQAKIDKKTESLRVEQSAYQQALVAIEGEIREELVTDNLGGQSKVSLTGKLYECEIGKARKETTVTDIDKVWKLLGDNVRKVASVPLGKLRDYLNPEELKQVLKEEHTGSRSFKVTRIV